MFLHGNYNAMTEKMNQVESINLENSRSTNDDFKNDKRHHKHNSRHIRQIDSNLNDYNSNKNISQGFSTSGQADSVVFERIIPKEVKKLWVLAVESPDYSIDRQHHSNQQNMIQSVQRTSEQLNRDRSLEYGDVLLSHDVLQEEKKQIPLRKDSVSESPELPMAS